jgi:hypothetical protein
LRESKIVKKRSKGLLRLAEETKLTAACAKLEAAQAELLAAVTKIADSGAPLNTDQAATYLQVSPGTLAVWRCLGGNRGPRFVLAGTLPRYVKSDLDAFLLSCTTKKKVSPNVGRPPKNWGRL